MLSQSIKLEGQIIQYNLVRSKRKTIGISIARDTTITVRAPIKSSQYTIEKALEEKSSWLLKHFNDFIENHHRFKPKKYIDGEKHFYLGCEYILKIVKSKHKNLELLDDKILVFGNNINTEQTRKLINKFYKNNAKNIFIKRLDKCYLKFKDFDIPYPKLKLRRMKKRWGSCSMEGHITLNYQLVKVPIECIDYVIVHELCHLVHFNHSKLFYSVQNKVLPDWKRLKKKLEEYSTY